MYVNASLIPRLINGHTNDEKIREPGEEAVLKEVCHSISIIILLFLVMEAGWGSSFFI